MEFQIEQDYVTGIKNLLCSESTYTVLWCKMQQLDNKQFRI